MAFDPGGATASRIAMPHMLPSTVPSVSASAKFFLSWLNPPPHPRDWLRKGFEAWFTALIELAWGKRRIMEVYLNVAEWGPGVYGAEAAAQYYFHKRADALNPGEAVRLAAALPDPLDWSPRRPGPRLLARGAAIRANMQGVPMGLPLPCGAGRA